MSNWVAWIGLGMVLFFSGAIAVTPDGEGSGAVHGWLVGWLVFLTGVLMGH
jgi:hypothetical protein